jgi:hypothetical protein
MISDSGHSDQDEFFDHTGCILYPYECQLGASRLCRYRKDGQSVVGERLRLAVLDVV